MSSSLQSLKSSLSTLIFLVLISSVLSYSNFLSNDNQYDPIRAKEFWYYSSACACNPNRIKTWNVSVVSDLYPNVTSITVSQNSSGENLAYSGYNPSTNLVFIMFRGSQNIQNWIEDLKLYQTDYEKCKDCKVHKGFKDAYLGIRDQALPAFFNLVQNYPNAKTLVSGHSLGAGIATLAFVDIFEKIGKINYFYTFGSPRVGNEKFSDFFSEKFENQFNARITHYKDIVPRLPLYYMGYKHIGHEIFYVEDNSKFVICQSNEDPTCINQFSIYDFIINDHTTYMGFNKKGYKATCQ